MTPLPPLSDELRSLVELAGIRIVLPARRPNGFARAGAHTSMRAGVRTLSAFYVRYDAQQAEEGPRLELVTLPRDRMLSSPHDPVADDESAVEAYLGREARRELAMRSLELRDSTAESRDSHLGEIILAREDRLPAASAITIVVDGRVHRAHTVSFEAHTATWSDLPSHGVAAIVYERRWQASREFVTFGVLP